MKHKTYDELIKMVVEFRLEHHNLTDDKLDKLVLRTFKIDRATLRDIDGVTDLISQVETTLNRLGNVPSSTSNGGYFEG
tara:strand:- start:5673 stop:5909 length:237 start_codon:yes stop_codon:yes gene_type:complete